VKDVLSVLLDAYGPQHWWPAAEPFEVMVGAVLVQQTSWNSAERAIAALRDAGLLDARALAVIDSTELERLIRPAGFFRVKARRLRRLAAFIRDTGGLERLNDLPTEALRSALLGLDGIGAETADAMLLYAFGRPAAVIDAYTRRLIARLDGTDTPPSDDVIRHRMLSAVADDVDALNELHALIVEHGKRVCGNTPSCADCVLVRRCRFGRRPEVIADAG
jgi:endonuclease III related protein